MTIHIRYDVFETCCDERPRVCGTFSGCGLGFLLGKSAHGLSRCLTATCSEGCQCFHLLEVDLFHRRRRHRNLRHLHRYCSEAC